MALLDRGANLEAIDSTGYTPLHIAIATRHMNMAMALIDRGADMNSKTNTGHTPLHIACVRNNIELAMALVDRGADINAMNYFGRPPLDYLSMENRNMLESMINRNVGNVMSSMVDRAELRGTVHETALNPSLRTRLSRLPGDMLDEVNSFLGGKRKTKKRKTRRRKTRKH